MSKIITNSSGISGSNGLNLKSHLSSISNNVNYVSQSLTLTTSNSVVLVNASSQEIVITLPPISQAKQNNFIIKKIDSSTNCVIISSSNSETIDENLSVLLPYKFDSLSIINDGINSWFIL